MNLHFTFRNLEATEALKSHIEKKVEKLTKIVTYPMEVHVIVSAEKTFHRAEITCYAEKQQLVGEDRSKDLYESIDRATHRIEEQMKREREKRKGHPSAHRASARKLAGDIKAEIPHRGKKTA